MSGARRAGVALVTAMVAVGSAVGFSGSGGVAPRGTADPPPNMIVVVSDDQTAESLPHSPPVMPYLQAQLEDPRGGWTSFPNTFATTPLCCPSRAGMLTGRTAAVTGVLDNGDGARLDDTSTVATWLQDAGYSTALVGKYLNGYPFPERPLVPPGWDRWVAKTNTSDATVYEGYSLVVDGVPVPIGTGPWTYSTDVLAAEAADFIATAPPDRPFFLWFSPPAPHQPWQPPERHAGAFAGLRIEDPPAVGETDVSDKPKWVRALAPVDAVRRTAFREDRRREYETLLGLDDALRTIDEALDARGALQDTVVLFMTDNGYALGEHRWSTKSCPYDACTRTPLFLRIPAMPARVDERLAANIDVAPTLASLAGVQVPEGVEGRSLVPSVSGEGAYPGWRDSIGLAFLGEDPIVPRWRAVRTSTFLFVEYETGEQEFYDLAGVFGAADPSQLENRSGDPALRAEVRRLKELAGAIPWSPQDHP
ncbi:MAG: sulfatase [Actinomycetota bacterium]